MRTLCCTQNVRETDFIRSLILIGHLFLSAVTCVVSSGSKKFVLSDWTLLGSTVHYGKTYVLKLQIGFANYLIQITCVVSKKWVQSLKCPI